MELRQFVGRLRPRGWNSWPERAYARDRYQHRLASVQAHLRECLDIAPLGMVRILSICAGDGRDVVGAVQSHARRDDMAAWLVELNEQSVALGVRHAMSAGLEKSLRFITGDATEYATYKNIPMSDVVLLCGVWGHVPAAERGSLVQAIASFCNPGATLIWTRGISKGVDRLHQIQALFAGPSWEEVRLSLTPDKKWAVATERYVGPPVQRPESGRIFNFRRSAGEAEKKVG